MYDEYGAAEAKNGNPHDEMLRMALAERQQEQVQQEARRRLAMYDEYGDDTFADGDVLAFTKQFQGDGGRAYRYAAIRAGGRWYLTGRTDHRAGTPLRWSELVLWLLSGDHPVPSEQVLSWEPFRS